MDWNGGASLRPSSLTNGRQPFRESFSGLLLERIDFSGDLKGAWVSCQSVSLSISSYLESLWGLYIEQISRFDFHQQKRSKFSIIDLIDLFTSFSILTWLGASFLDELVFQTFLNPRGLTCIVNSKIIWGLLLERIGCSEFDRSREAWDLYKSFEMSIFRYFQIYSRFEAFF